MPRAYLAALAMAVSGACLAQANVGDVVKQGGTKMTKEELQQLHAGCVTLKGTLANGTPYSQVNKADGTVGGVGGNNNQFTLSGTWKIDDTGKYCHHIATSGGIRANSRNFVFKAGSKYFVTTSPADTPETAVRERQFVN